MRQQRKSLLWLLEEQGEQEVLVGEVQQLLVQVLGQQRLEVLVDVVQRLEQELERQSRHHNLWQP